MEINAFGLICTAIVIEGIITYVKTFFKDGKFQWQMLVAIALGILVAVAYQLDIFALLGMVSTIPFVGCILTGILLSRGSNNLFDLVNLLASVIKKIQTTEV